jgi:hypothetical protein
MNITKREAFLKSLAEIVESRMGQAGFQQSDCGEWVRPTTWKTDVVRLLARELSYMINLSVTIPSAPGSKLDSQLLAFANLASVCGRETADYNYPTWRVGSSECLAAVATDLATALTWFSHFDSPRRCLDHVLSIRVGETAVFQPGSLGFRYCVAYLTELEKQGGQA